MPSSSCSLKKKRQRLGRCNPYGSLLPSAWFALTPCRTSKKSAWVALPRSVPHLLRCLRALFRCSLGCSLFLLPYIGWIEPDSLRRRSGAFCPCVLVNVDGLHPPPKKMYNTRASLADRKGAAFPGNHREEVRLVFDRFTPANKPVCASTCGIVLCKMRA